MSMRIFGTSRQTSGATPIGTKNQWQASRLHSCANIYIGRVAIWLSKMRSSDAVFQEAPAPINRLRSGFDLNLFLGARELVFYYLDVTWIHFQTPRTFTCFLQRMTRSCNTPSTRIR